MERIIVHPIGAERAIPARESYLSHSNRISPSVVFYLPADSGGICRPGMRIGEEKAMFFYFRRFLLFSMVLVLLLPALGCSLIKAKSSQVLMIVSEQSDDMDFMLVNEVGVMVDLLEKAGLKVTTATVSGETLSGLTTSLKPDMKLSAVKVEDYAGILVPCLARNLEAATPPEVIEIIKQASAKDMVMAAQLGGVLMLQDAGVLGEKQTAMFADLETFFSDSSTQGEWVVQDGKIITSIVCPYMARMTGKKDGTAELTQKFIEAVKSN
jgi:putative intracellular protease/amidase